MKKLFLLSCATLLMGGLAFFGCKKNNDVVNADSDTQTAVDNEVSESATKDAHNMCAAAYKAKSENKPDFRISGSSNIEKFAEGVHISKFDSTDGFRYLLCDFKGGIVCGDGLTRSGIIRAKWTSKTSYDSASVKTIDFIGYSYRGRTLSGKVIVSKDANVPTKTNIQAKVTLKRSASDSTTISSSTTQELLTGTDSTITTNTYKITGSSSGISSKGVLYDASITKTLIKDMSCAYFIDGTIKYTITGKSDRQLIFGNGTLACHSIDTIKIGNTGFVVDFKKY